MSRKRQRVSFRKDFYEKTAWQNGDVACGIDEVGRGCLAGPLVTAAVILRSQTPYRLLKDSKTLSQEELQRAAKWIKKNSWYAYGIVSPRIIDKINIYMATLLGMKKAVMGLFSSHIQRPSIILVDAMPLSLADTCYRDIKIAHFPKGESKSRSIAAASIIAKVKRDSMMAKLGTFFPAYQLEKHKGYGTKDHQQALFMHNQSIIHRETFLKEWYAREDEERSNQQALC